MANSFSGYLKRNSIQLKIGLIMIIAVILLAATSYFLYRNLSEIVSSIKIDQDPEMRLLSIRDLSMDLEKAGNSVRIYSITREPKDIKPYYSIISKIDDKVSRLRSENIDDTVMLAQTDTISYLIEKNIVIWNGLLGLYNDSSVLEYMKVLSDQYTTASETNQKRERGILRRVFSRPPESPVNEEAIAEDLKEIVRQDQSKKDELLQRESQLAVNSNEITGKLYDVMAKMENEVYNHISQKAGEASIMADKIYRLLIMLSISGGLLGLLVLFIIIRFVRKAYSYQLALENSKDEAEKLARTKELFMANMSHEIRTPVTAISGFTEQLLHEPFDEATSRSLKIIKSSSDHLLKIIDDILDFSKLQNNKLTLEQVHFSLPRIMEDVKVLFGQQAARNNSNLGFTIQPETPQVLVGDPYRLKQIMINLVSNSVKFTKNGSVHFSASAEEVHDEGIVLSMEFTDTGIGIDETKIKTVFEDFTQAEMSTTRKYGGTGLGLSIVKSLVDLHGGTIDITSKRNHGTRIVCRIPFRIGNERLIKSEPVRPASLPAGIAGLKILIVDDEEYNRMLFKKILDRWKVISKEVVNGMDALEILKEERFDLLFMDMRMPGIDGLKATQFIRSEMKISETEMPVILISAAPLNEDFQKYAKAGMNAFLQKPFTEDSLLATILSVITARQPQTDAALQAVNDNDKENSTRIDLNSLYHISGGDNQFVKQMLKSFITTTGNLLNEMQEAVASERWESVADLAHKILPPCRHLGAKELSGLLSDIEEEGRSGNQKLKIASLAERSLIEFISVRSQLDEHLAKMN